LASPEIMKSPCREEVYNRNRAHRIGVAYEYLPNTRFAAAGSSPKAPNVVLAHANDGTSRSRAPPKASSRASQSEASKDKSTKTNSRLQGLEMILRRYGGDAPSRPLTTSKSTPLPTSQRLRLTASARRPIEEDNPFNPARVSRRGVHGHSLATRDNSRRGPSNSIQRSYTMASEGRGERHGANSESRSTQVR
jgi:hypothetical protein